MFNPGKPYPLYVRMCIGLILTSMVIFLLVAGRELLIPFTIAVLLTFILLPLSQRLERFHIPRAIAIFISILIAFILLTGVVYFLYTQIQSFGDDFDELKTKIGEKANAVQRFIGEYFDISKKDQTKWLDKKVSNALEQGDQFLISVFTTTGTFLTNLLLIPIYIYFLTLYRSKVKKFISMVSNNEHKHVYEIISKIVVVAQKYLKGLMVDVMIVAVLLSAGFFLLQVKHALLFGLLVAICNVILPYMGITIGSILPFCMMVLTRDHFGPAVGVIAFCIAMQFTDNHFINPYVVGSSVSINPLTAFLALVASAMIWGIYGMLLCIPVMGMVKVVCDNVEQLRPYGFIIGQEQEFGQDMDRKKKKLAHKISSASSKSSHAA